MSHLTIPLDDQLARHLEALAERERLPLADWVAVQLARTASSAEGCEGVQSYSPEWVATFGTIPDEDFEPPVRRPADPVELLDAH